MLDLLPEDALTGRPLFIRSAPGGGKTSLLKLFTPSVLQHLVAMKGNDAVKELFGKLKGLGAVSDHDINVLSVMLPCGRTFPALADVELKPTRAKRLLLALIDARVILGALRAILIARGLRFPDDLSRLTLVAPPDDHVPGLSFPSDGVAVQRWAETIEQGVADLIDTLMSPEGAGTPGHDALLSLRLLDANCIQLDGKPFETRWLITFDDMQKLAPAQRAALLEIVVDQRARSTVWLAERFEALFTDELLASGALSGRDHLVINLEREWKKGRFEPAVKLIAERRARMAAESAGANAPDAFAPTIEADLDAPAWQEKTQAALDVVRKRVQILAASKALYADWVKSRADVEGTPPAQWKSPRAGDRRHWRSGFQRAQQVFARDRVGAYEPIERAPVPIREALERYRRHEVPEDAPECPETNLEGTTGLFFTREEPSPRTQQAIDALAALSCRRSPSPANAAFMPPRVWAKPSTRD